jgi:hypothetical protein
MGLSWVISLANLLKSLLPRKPKLVVRFRSGISTRYNATFCSFSLTFTLSNNGTKSCSLIEWKVILDNITYEPRNLQIQPKSSPQTIDIPEGNARELNVIGYIHVQDVEISELKGRILLEFSHGKKDMCNFCVKMEDGRNIGKKGFQKKLSSEFLDDLPPINLP